MTTAARITSTGPPQTGHAPVRADGEYVIYWMVATRRLGWSHALDRALEHATRLARPFLIFEPLGLARMWQITKERLRLWPFKH